MKMRTVSLEIYHNIAQYFKEYLPQYELQEVFPYSENPREDHLYMVIAKNKKYPKIKQDFGGGPWVCWTSWNEKTQSLNFGHYDLKTYDAAYDICMAFYRRMIS
jgi:hypothetical protein